MNQPTASERGVDLHGQRLPVEVVDHIEGPETSPRISTPNVERGLAEPVRAANLLDLTPRISFLENGDDPCLGKSDLLIGNS